VRPSGDAHFKEHPIREGTVSKNRQLQLVGNPPEFQGIGQRTRARQSTSERPARSFALTLCIRRRDETARTDRIVVGRVVGRFRPVGSGSRRGYPLI